MYYDLGLVGVIGRGPRDLGCVLGWFRTIFPYFVIANFWCQGRSSRSRKQACNHVVLIGSCRSCSLRSRIVARDRVLCADGSSISRSEDRERHGGLVWRLALRGRVGKFAIMEGMDEGLAGLVYTFAEMKSRSRWLWVGERDFVSASGTYIVEIACGLWGYFNG